MHGLLETERKANLGMSCIIKKFIAELPEQINPSMFEKYEEAKSKLMSGTLNKLNKEQRSFMWKPEDCFMRNVTS